MRFVVKPFIRVGDAIYRRASAVELHLFDFDGTLFRSPPPPSWWGSEQEWYTSLSSLDRPCVPNHPDETWWIMDNVYAARESITNPNVYAILLTGREDPIFHDRVHKLLTQQGLDFDEIHLCNQENKLKFKLEVLAKILGLRDGTFSKARCWDDQDEDLGIFVSAFSSIGLAVDSHLVDEDPHAALCGPENYQQ